MREFQRQFLTLALRRAARGTGSSPEFLARRTALQALPNLAAMLGPLKWVLVRGFAIRAFMPERITQDVDILIHESDEAQACSALTAAGYTITGQFSIGGFSAERMGEMPIDVLTGCQPWLEIALETPAHDASGYPVLTRPYLMLLKLQAGRTQDLADVQRMLRDTPPTERQATHTLLSKLDSDLGEEFAALIMLADFEFGPPR